MRHATDGALVRWLDHQCDATEAPVVELHIDGCWHCRARLARLSRQSDVVRRALEVDRVEGWGARGRRLLNRPVRAGAAAAAALVLVVAVKPVRAWVVERAAAIWAAVVQGRFMEGSGQETPAAMGSAGEVTFVPVGDTFLVEVAHRQSAGRLIIEPTAESTVSARVTTQTDGADLVVLPAGIRIVNPVGASASYALVVPATLSVVVLRIADEPPVRLERLRPGDRWEVDLGANRAR